MHKLVSELGIDESFTKVRNKVKQYNDIKSNIPLIEDYNFMADILFLPTDSFGFKYLLVCLDLANDQFDIEPLKNKESTTTLKALKKMFTRPYLNKPYASITTDQGTEFSGAFNQYLYDESIFHKVTKPGRHQQLGNIDSLIKQLGRLFNGLMNKQEMKTGKVSKAWTKYIPVVRDGLNKARLKKLPDNYDDEYIYAPLNLPIDKKGNIIKNKYKIGDLVHVALDRPESVLGKKQTGTKFRTGDNRFDPKARKIIKVLYYNGKNTYRYMVEGIHNVSYAESDIFMAS
jgi:hypothetical protein